MFVRPDFSSFIEAMREPALLATWPLSRLESTVRYARRANLLASLAERVAAAGVEVPALDAAFEGARIYAAEHRRFVEWEMQQFAPLAERLAEPVLVLKGGAYLGMGLSSAAGRLVSDLDLLVPRAALGAFEAEMLADGYQAQKTDEYDQHYYREWMHELPPMLHLARGVVVDLHHNIAPSVSRLKIDADALIERAVPLREGLPYLRLCDEDMVLHLCVHMFHDGELNNALRELFDLDALLRRFGRDETFWKRLLVRARDLALMRPLYYGVHFSRSLIGTPVPVEVNRFLQIAAPLQPARWVLESAMRRSLLPATGERNGLLRGLSGQLLYLRSHWLRMPPRMLVKHLWTQYRRRGGLITGDQAVARGGDV